MTKVTFVFAVGTVLFIFFKYADSTDQFQQESAATPEESIEDEPERAGAFAHANVMVPRLRPGPLQPQPAPIPINLVECIVCTDCPQVSNNTMVKMCPYTFDITKQNKCIVYAEKYRHMKRPWYIRGCASEKGSCSDILRAHSSHSDIVKLLFCEECEGDGCNTNGASHSLVDFTMAFFAIVVTPVVAKYTLS